MKYKKSCKNYFLSRQSLQCLLIIKLCNLLIIFFFQNQRNIKYFHFVNGKNVYDLLVITFMMPNTFS